MTQRTPHSEESSDDRDGALTEDGEVTLFPAAQPPSEEPDLNTDEEGSPPPTS